MAGLVSAVGTVFQHSGKAPRNYPLSTFHHRIRYDASERDGWPSFDGPFYAVFAGNARRGFPDLGPCWRQV